MKKTATTLLLLAAISGCETTCPFGQAKIGVACVDILPDGGPDAGLDTSQGADGGSDASNDTGNAFDGCTPMPETCNGVSDDCDDSVDEGACDFPNTQASCEASGCVFSACDDGFLDCSGDLECETVSDRNNCGECGIACGATESCQAGACVEHTLDWWWTTNEPILVASGSSQRYFLTAVSDSNVLTSSENAPIAIDDTLGGSLLVAVSETGGALWQVRISGANSNVVALRSIAGVDGVYVAGVFRGGTMTANGPGTNLSLENPGTNSNGFVLRVDQTGSVQPVYHLADLPGGDESQIISDMAVSATGQVFVIGRSRGGFVKRGGNTPALTTPEGAFNFILNNEHAIVTPAAWEKIALDDENAYVVARLDDGVVVELGGVEYSSVGATFAPLIGSLDHDLVLQWVQTPLSAEEGQGEDDPLCLHADHGSVYLGQSFSRSHTFGGYPLEAGGFIASLAALDGAVNWVRGTGFRAPSISTTSDRIYVAGSGTGTSVDLGGGTLGDAINQDVLIGTFQRNGDYEFARMFGGLDIDAATDVQATSTGMMISARSGSMTVDDVGFDGGRSVMHFSVGSP